jgi:hypothetical protein
MQMQTDSLHSLRHGSLLPKATPFFRVLTFAHKPPALCGAFALAWVAFTAQALAAGSVVTTNYITVTNVVLVTNYVTVQAVAVGTNLLVTGQANSRLPDLNWVRPVDIFDWIQLKSGEWLKGTIKAMQKHELEFDSEELDHLKFDWDDILQVRSSHPLDVLFVDGRFASGPFTITPRETTVGGAEPRVFPREQIQGFAPGGSRERRFYLLLPFAEYYEDPFQNLAGRATGGVGLGYDVVDRQKMEWSITTGPRLPACLVRVEPAQRTDGTRGGGARLWQPFRLEPDPTPRFNPRIPWPIHQSGGRGDYAPCRRHSFDRPDPAPGP